MKITRVLAIAAATIAASVAVGIPASAGNGNADIEHRTYQCDVNWVSAPGGTFVNDPACDITNIRTPGGSYVEILRGQVPEDQMDAFVASGVRSLEGYCWVNYLFLEFTGPDSEPDPAPIVVESVRRFTPGGQMTEVCRYNPDMD